MSSAPGSPSTNSINPTFGSGLGVFGSSSASVNGKGVKDATFKVHNTIQYTSFASYQHESSGVAASLGENPFEGIGGAGSSAQKMPSQEQNEEFDPSKHSPAKEEEATGSKDLEDKKAVSGNEATPLNLGNKLDLTTESGLNIYHTIPVLSEEGKQTFAKAKITSVGAVLERNENHRQQSLKNWFYVAVLVGVIGLALAGVGATAYYAHLQALPKFMNTLQFLGNLKLEGSIALASAGAFLLGAASFSGILILRERAKRSLLEQIITNSELRFKDKKIKGKT